MAPPLPFTSALLSLFLLPLLPLSLSNASASAPTSLTRASASVPVPCPAGTYLPPPSSSSCTPCPPGTYSSLPAATACTPCPPGTSQPLRGASKSYLCRPCYPGFHAPAPSSARCAPCPPGKHSGFASPRCARCPPGTAIRYVGRAVCQRCDAGTYSSTANSLECTPCHHGHVTWRKVNGKPRPVACGNCIISSSSTDGKPGHTVFNRCGKCPVAMFRDRATGECTKCPVGTDSVASNGFASSVRQCIPCKPGFARGDFGYQCERCDAGVPAARGRGAATCVRRSGMTWTCGHTYHVFMNGNGSCVKCRPGWRRDVGNNACVQCAPGATSPGGAVTACVVCADIPGSAPSRDAAECTCGAGRHVVTVSKGMTGGEEKVCKMCPKGTFRNDESHVADQGCEPCATGYVAGRGEAMCTRCAYGSVPNATRDGCVACDEKGKGEVANLLTVEDVYYRHGQSRCIDGRSAKGQFGKGHGAGQGYGLYGLYFYMTPRQFEMTLQKDGVAVGDRYGGARRR